MKAEDTEVKIKRTRSARKPEERRDGDQKQKLSKHVNIKYQSSSYKVVGFCF